MNAGNLSTAGAFAGLEGLLAELEVSTAQGAGTEVNTGEVEVDAIPGDTQGEVVAAEETPVVVEAATPAKGKGKKGGKNKGKKAKPAEAATQEPAAEAAASTDAPQGDEKPAETPPAETKPAAAPKIFFGRNKLGRLAHKLGDGVDNAMLFELVDCDLEGEALAALIAQRKTDFKVLAVKVQNRATNVIEFATGKAQRLNPVIEITLRLLAKDRKLSTGYKGNLFMRLSTLYTGGSARAMGNSTMGMLKALKIVNETAKQTFEPNVNSTLLAVISDKLLLSFIDRDEAIAEAVKDEADALAAAADPVDNTESLATAADQASDAASTDGEVSIEALIAQVEGNAGEVVQEQGEPALV